MICGFGRGSGLGLVWPLQNNQLVIFVLEIWIRSFISLASWNRLGLLLIQDLPLKSIQFTKTAGSKSRSFVEVRRRFPQDRPRSALNWGRRKFSIFDQFFIWYHFPCRSLRRHWYQKMWNFLAHLLIDIKRLSDDVHLLKRPRKSHKMNFQCRTPTKLLRV